MTVKLKAEDLEDMQACGRQVAKFKRAFPKGMPLGVFSWQKAEALRKRGFDVMWMADRMTEGDSYTEDVLDPFRLLKTTAWENIQPQLSTRHQGYGKEVELTMKIRAELYSKINEAMRFIETKRAWEMLVAKKQRQAAAKAAEKLAAKPKKRSR